MGSQELDTTKELVATKSPPPIIVQNGVSGSVSTLIIDNFKGLLPETLPNTHTHTHTGEYQMMGMPLVLVLSLSELLATEFPTCQCKAANLF